MPTETPIVQLRSANERLHALLVQLRQETFGAGTAGTDTFVHVLAEVANTAQLSILFEGGGKNAVAAEELSKYRQTLQELFQLLPAIQTRLLSDRARLEAERLHCCAATAWAEANRQTL